MTEKLPLSRVEVAAVSVIFGACSVGAGGLTNLKFTFPVGTCCMALGYGYSGKASQNRLTFPAETPHTTLWVRYCGKVIFRLAFSWQNAYSFTLNKTLFW
jgi:hypothetical protein